MKMGKLFKEKRIKIILSCCLLLTVFFVGQMLIPLRSYVYDGATVIPQSEEEHSVIIFEGLALPAGVYEVELEYRTDTNMKNLCIVKDGTVFAGGLLTNGEHLHKNLGRTDFRFWLFESTEALQVSIEYSGEGYVETGSLTILETNALWSMCLVILWAVTGIIVTICGLQTYGKTSENKGEYKTTIIVLFVIALFSSLPYLQSGNMGGGDLVYHLMRIEGVKDGLLSGQFPVRIDPEWLFGHGYANSIFYCNTLLYIPALLRLAGFPVTICYNIYCIGINIATVGISYFCFYRIFQKKYIGYLCSALYSLSVFRIYKLVFTAALGEGSAFTFLPLVMYGLYRAFTEDVYQKKYRTVWLTIAVGYAGLLQTHVLSCEITAFLTILICLIFVRKIVIRQTFVQLAKGALAALAMSAWYLVPFLDYYINEDVHIRHVSARTIQERGLYIPQLFMNWWRVGDNALTGDLGMTESHPMGVGAVLGAGFFCFVIMWFMGEWRKQSDHRIRFGKIACLLSALLMIMSLNSFPWDAIQSINPVAAALVSSIQFPNRFLGWGTVLLVAVFGCLLWYTDYIGKKSLCYLVVVCALVGIATSGIYLLDHMCRDKTYLHVYNEEGMGFGYISGAEYLPEKTEQDLLEYTEPVESEGVSILDYSKRYLNVQMECMNTSEADGYVELPLLYYTGYHAYEQETKKELLIEGGHNQLIRVWIPSGFAGEVEVEFVVPLHWRIAELVTYLWYVCLIALFGIQRKNDENTK